MHNVPKWSDAFKVCLTILGHYALKGKNIFILADVLLLLIAL